MKGFEEHGFYEAKTANDAWEHWFSELTKQAADRTLIESRDGPVCGEVLNSMTVIKDPTRNIVSSLHRNLSMRYAVGELLWYLSGSNDMSHIAKFSKVWEKLSDDGHTINSAYGHRIFSEFGFNQLEFVRRMLMDQPGSRQALIHIKDPCDYLENPTKDVPCTIALQYTIRENKLYATTYMRSNDIWTGFPYDVFSFTCLQIILAFRLNVDIGTYTHIAGSLHLYDRDYKKWQKGVDPIGSTCSTEEGCS